MPVVTRQSTETFERISCVFYVTVNLDPEVDSRFAWKSRYPRAPCIWQSLRAVLMRPVHEGFWENFIFLREGGLSGLVRTWKSEHYFKEQLL